MVPLGFPVPPPGESAPCPACGALGRWHDPADGTSAPPMWFADEMIVRVADAAEAGQCDTCGQWHTIQGHKPTARPVDPVERAAGLLEARIRAEVARTIALSAHRAPLPADLPPAIMRSIGTAVDAVLREYRAATGSTALPYPGGGVGSELVHLRSLLWRIASGEITDWSVASESKVGTDGAVDTLTLYYPTGL